MATSLLWAALLTGIVILTPSTDRLRIPLVIGVLVVVRFAWMFPAATLARFRPRRRTTASPYGARETETVAAAWAGMRGLVTVATALALPTVTDRGGSEFPMRAEIVFVGLACVLAALVVQGLTLAPVVRAQSRQRGGHHPGGGRAAAGTRRRSRFGRRKHPWPGSGLHARTTCPTR